MASFALPRLYAGVIDDRIKELDGLYAHTKTDEEIEAAVRRDDLAQRENKERGRTTRPKKQSEMREVAALDDRCRDVVHEDVPGVLCEAPVLVPRGSAP